jgi:hypothetical protein
MAKAGRKVQPSSNDRQQKVSIKVDITDERKHMKLLRRTQWMAAVARTASLSAARVLLTIAPAVAIVSAAHAASIDITRDFSLGSLFVNSIGANAKGDVWVATQSGVINRFTHFQYPMKAKRVAVDPNGLPWIVDFDGHIWRATANNGPLTEMPGLARDIAIGRDGVPWVIGTNSRNGSFQVWSWNGSAWVADPGSGEEIDVSADGFPVVNGSDNKIWIRDGGSDQGWSQITGGALDIAAGSYGRFSGGRTGLWIIGTDNNIWNLTSGWAQLTTGLVITQIVYDPFRGVLWGTDPDGELLQIGSSLVVSGIIDRFVKD